jgi:1-acyl-sn-glycerol-3-phosphate acyltransferase
LRTGAPIIPVGVKGTRDIQPPEAKMPRLFKTAEINIGRPISVERYRDRADDHIVLRQIIDEVMFEIRELSGQDYVDVYATKKAETFPSAEQGHVTTLEEAAGHGNGQDEPAGDAARRSSADVLSPPRQA